MMMKQIFTFSYDFSGAARGLQKSGEKKISMIKVCHVVSILILFSQAAHV